MPVRVTIAGITGWTGRCLGQALVDSDGFALVAGVARGAAGQDAGAVLDREALGWKVSKTVVEALAEDTDVLVDFTHPTVVKEHVKTALDAGVSVVIGTSGLSAADFQEIEEQARKRGKGVVAAGNFSVTAALVKHFAEIAARHVPHWEILDYAHAGKPDAPSGTAQELAEALGKVARNEQQIPVSRTVGNRETRGATIGGAQVHSLRLPGHVLSFEALFGLPDERLTLRHDAGASAAPYVGGVMRAIQSAAGTVGLIRGMDTLLFGEPSGTGDP